MSDVKATTAYMDELLAFLPILEDEQFVAVAEWNPWPKYTADASAFFRLAGKPCWNDYDYLVSEASKRIDDDAFVASASLTDIKAM